MLRRLRWPVCRDPAGMPPVHCVFCRTLHDAAGARLRGRSSGSVFLNGQPALGADRARGIIILFLKARVTSP